MSNTEEHSTSVREERSLGFMDIASRPISMAYCNYNSMIVGQDFLTS
jgi:hypothetical protein